MKVKFVPQNVEFEIKPSESVLNVAQENGLYIKSVCKGVPSCAECRVRVVGGEHNVLPPMSEELLLIGTGYFIDQRRLSCQMHCFGDITVDMTEQNQKLAMGGTKSKGLAVTNDRVEDITIRTTVTADVESDPETDAESAVVESDVESVATAATVGPGVGNGLPNLEGKSDSGGRRRRWRR
jgi:2Fe-2S ferredoxin